MREEGAGNKGNDDSPNNAIVTGVCIGPEVVAGGNQDAPRYSDPHPTVSGPRTN